MKVAIVMFIALQFSHYLPLVDEGEMFDFAQLSSSVLLLKVVFSLVEYRDLCEKRCVLILIGWMVVSCYMNMFSTAVFDISTRMFCVVDFVCLIFLAYQLFRKTYEYKNDVLNSEDVFYLLPPPTEVLGLILSTSRFQFGGRMVIHNNSLYAIKKGVFRKIPLKSSVMNNKVLLNTGSKYSSKLDALTGKKAHLIFSDCRRYIFIFGRVMPLLRNNRV